jgi:SAM-dependent methyltransferase
LDIGCGTHPYFLAHTYFREKYAIDQSVAHKDYPEICWFSIDLNKENRLPFDDSFFSAITLLAVVEHLDPENLVLLFGEVYRTLKPGGVAVITTPAAWSNNLLRWMARLNLVSKEEIDEHVFAYTLPLLGWYLGKAGFKMRLVRFGYFEGMLNLWATANR